LDKTNENKQEISNRVLYQLLIVKSSIFPTRSKGEMALPQKSFSFTLGFSPVENNSHCLRNRFNGFLAKPAKTVETVFC